MALRSVRKWSRHVARSIHNYDRRFIERWMKRESQKPREEKEKIAGTIRRYHARESKSKRRGRLILHSIIADTIIKNLRLKKRLSAKKLSRLKKLIIDLGIVSMELAIVKNKKEGKLSDKYESIAEEIIKIIGWKNRKKFFSELNELERITGQVVI